MAPLRVGKRLLNGVRWAGEAEDGAVEVTIAPNHKAPYLIIGTLLHELIHAGGINDHYRDFAAAGRALGLVGKPKGMGYEEAPYAALPWPVRETLSRLGPWPGAYYELPSRARRSGAASASKTRMLKCDCAKCGMILRGSAAAFGLVDGRLTKHLRCMDASCDGEVRVFAGP